MENQKLPRLTVKEMKREALLFFNLEKGIPFTFISLLRKPLETIDEYLNYDRRKYSNPIKYLLFAVAMYALLISFNSNFKEFTTSTNKMNAQNYKPLEEKLNIEIAKPFEEAQKVYFSYQNVFIIFSLPLLGFVTYLFSREKYNYAENLVIIAFTYGTTNWISMLVTIITSFFTLPFMYLTLVVTTLTLMIFIYFFGKIFKQKIFLSALTGIIVLISSIFISAIFQLLLNVCYVIASM